MSRVARQGTTAAEKTKVHASRGVQLYPVLPNLRGLMLPFAIGRILDMEWEM